MSRVLVAGVDTSTQSTKVRVTDAETGEMVRFGQAKHPDGTSVNPDAWWQAFQEAAEQAGGLDDVAALAVGGQQHGMVLLDDHGRVIRDALLWNDTRSATNADVLIACLDEDFGGRIFVMFNPTITAKDGAYDASEGCLSLKGERRTVRFQRIEVSYADRKFRERHATFTGFTAQIIQHEIDHCEGIII